jgi:hypothetical protein
MLTGTWRWTSRADTAIRRRACRWDRAPRARPSCQNRGGRRGVLGQDQRMILHPDMIVRENCGHISFAHNRRAIHERSRLDQRSLHLKGG